MEDIMRVGLAAPEIVDRSVFQEQLDALRIREKAHTREGDAIAAARRRLPMVEVDPTTKLIGPQGPVTLLDTFEGRRQLIAYYFMWRDSHRSVAPRASRVFRRLGNQQALILAYRQLDPGYPKTAAKARTAELDQQVHRNPATLVTLCPFEI